MICFLDTSVIFGILNLESKSAAKWFTEMLSDKSRILTASKMAEVEVYRTARRRNFDLHITHEFLESITFVSITDEICAEAMNLEPKLRGADAIHVATALRISGPDLVMATHDAEMARAAIDLGIKVIDPVTDDPNRPPVA